jgi:hypothetical protein
MHTYTYSFFSAVAYSAQVFFSELAEFALVRSIKFVEKTDFPSL